ncbi:EmrB/QacA subfamily drug resistance transporter [Paenibacillus cellulosilyticus]|uniref:EmrB/QacA subfamily drug resistance transporter n=1 Tax=Paenibacillus cellulosilyticus TaxID=375489 RepID=A0A2V2YW91_9BACL|nr:MDR family MFS transporter [Paenibacillus cellulosilyticus]PWW05231.1 EmrB/QacA subfamily drug resistance transporter [Paenibacillus cellulosilyticus]QKS43555.1 MFS transporter [Paenibacillus cellulosilyticus]
MAIQGNNKTLVLIGLMLGLIFSGLDETVVSTAMPTIIRELHGLSLYGWVAGVYMLAITMFMPIIGKLADLYGRKKVYMICMGLFIAGSIVSGLADSMVMLLVGRGIQGIGAGGLMPLSLVIIGETYPLEQRAKIQSLIGPLMIIPQLLGPTLGGYIVGHVSWHWIFLINIPVGLVAALVLARGMKESIGTEKRSVDWAGAATLVMSLMSLLLAPVLIDTKGYSWGSPVIIGMLVLAAIFMAAFIRIERRAAEPIIPLSLFRNRTVIVLSLLVFTIMFGAMGGMATFPLFLQNVIGLTPTASGYMLLSFMAGAVPASIVNGFVITKVPYKRLFIGSFILPVVGFFMLTYLTADTSVLYIIASCFILGVGMGVLFGSDNLIVQESVDSSISGVALSTVQLVQSLGATMGFSIFGSLLAGHIKNGLTGMGDQLPANTAETIATDGIPKGLPDDVLLQVKTIFADSFNSLFMVGAVFAVAAFIITWFMKKEVLTPKKEDGQQPPSAATVSAEG